MNFITCLLQLITITKRRAVPLLILLSFTLTSMNSQEPFKFNEGQLEISVGSGSYHISNDKELNLDFAGVADPKFHITFENLEWCPI